MKNLNFLIATFALMGPLKGISNDKEPFIDKIKADKEDNGGVYVIDKNMNVLHNDICHLDWCGTENCLNKTCPRYERSLKGIKYSELLK